MSPALPDAPRGTAAADPAHRRRRRRRVRRRRVGRLRRRIELAHLTPAGRAWLVVELTALYFGLPTVAIAARWSGVVVPVVPSLLVVTLAIWLGLVYDRGFRLSRLTRVRGVRRELRRILGLFAAGAACMTAYTALVEPELLLAFPRERTALWAAVMVFYPLLSVYPQELIYRVFFVHRYGAFLGSPRLVVAVGAFAFGYVHLLYGHWLSVALSTVGGVLFTWTYLRSRSIFASAFEHALYGCFIFTIGLGPYFYDAAA